MTPKPNYGRMMAIIDDVFSTRSDPDQLQVNPQQLKKLQSLHPATLSELADDNGPVIWVLMIPTTTAIMQAFIEGAISEKELLNRTQPSDMLDCIYLCSATTLPEYRGKGKTKEICLKAIQEIRNSYPINTLAVWPFTPEGDQLAATLAKECGMGLMIKRGH